MRHFGCGECPLYVLALLIPLTFLIPNSTQAQLAFNISSTGNQDVDDGFQMAADFWSARYNDDVTINIDAGFEDLGGSVLGSSRNVSTNYNFSTFRNRMLANIVTEDDQTFVDALPGGTSFTAYANNSFGNPNGTGPYTASNLTNVFINRSNAKALGLIDGQDTQSDSTITFNNTFAFDFDPSDGINAGQLDFVGIAIHEIGHTMGFTSSVDFIAAVGDQLPISSLGPSILDFSRFSPDSVAAGTFDLTSDTRAKFFSIDGGVTAAAPGLNHWSLGGANDGRQASNWKDNLGLGIMDPTAAPRGQLNIATELDFMAIDILGWDRVAVVPEPGSLLFIAAFGIGTCLRRRRSI